MQKKPSKLKALVEEVNALHAKMQKDGQKALKGAFADFFKAHPEAKAIVWTQYTPYFNDGDTCTFGVNGFSLHVDPKMMAEDVQKMMGFDPTEEVEEPDQVDEDEDEYEDDEDSSVNSILSSIEDNEQNRRYLKESWSAAGRAGVALRELTESEKQLLTDFNELENDCGAIDEVLEMVLGDHVQVTATRSGFKTSDYEHD